MSDKHSIASKARWAKISSDERSRRMSETAKKRWAKASDEERLEQSKIMVEAKRKKNAG